MATEVTAIWIRRTHLLSHSWLPEVFSPPAPDLPAQAVGPSLATRFRDPLRPARFFRPPLQPPLPTVRGARSSSSRQFCKTLREVRATVQRHRRRRSRADPALGSAGRGRTRRDTPPLGPAPLGLSDARTQPAGG